MRQVFKKVSVRQKISTPSPPRLTTFKFAGKRQDFYNTSNGFRLAPP